jgi:hypothetical protein
MKHLLILLLVFGWSGQLSKKEAEKLLRANPIPIFVCAETVDEATGLKIDAKDIKDRENSAKDTVKLLKGKNEFKLVETAEDAKICITILGILTSQPVTSGLDDPTAPTRVSTSITFRFKVDEYSKAYNTGFNNDARTAASNLVSTVTAFALQNAEKLVAERPR